MKNMKKNQKRKIKKLTPTNNRRAVGGILFGITLGVFLLFIVRFSFVVATGKVAGNSLDEKTASLYQGTTTVKAKRGTIYDRNGEVIATDATSYSLYAVLDKTYKIGQEKLYVEPENVNKIADILSSNTELSKSTVQSILSQTKNADGEELKQVEFGTDGKNLTLETKNKIEEELKDAKIQGIYFTAHPARLYQNGAFASYVVGYTDLVSETNESKGLEGTMGIEASYDDVLSGTDGEVRYQKDSSGNAIPGTSVVIKEAKDGEDIYLTLDKTLQLFAESELEKLQTEYEPNYATVMLLEAKTGNILVAAQTPTFDPETWKEDLSKKGALWEDLLVERSFEPGSTIKAFTVAAAIETGNYNPGAVFQAGSIKLYDEVLVKDAVIRDQLTYEQALIASSNVGMINLEMMMDGSTGMVWPDYLQKFGFAKTTHSKLPGEAEGYIQSENPVDRAMTAYGQALSVTSFQMVQGYTMFANGGEMLKPNYIQKMVDVNTGKETVTPREVVDTPIQASTARQVLDTMEKVVSDPIGTGRAFGIDGVNVSAKTGTAQISEKGVYLTGSTDYIYSVVELVPTEDPEYLLYVTVRQPKKYDIGVLSNVTNSLMKKTLELDSEANASDATKETIEVEDVTGKSVTEVTASAMGQRLNMVVIGDGGTIVSQSAKAGELLMSGQRFMIYAGGTITLPDFTGWSKNDVLKYCELANIEVTFTGKGYARKQNVDEGTVMNEGSKVSVSLGDSNS